MEATFVILSRPLLIRADRYKDDYFYQPVYGFVIVEGSYSDQEIEEYVGYLAGLHDWSNAGHSFDVTYMDYGIPNWVDYDGNTHPHRDDWMVEIGKECIRKYGLSFKIFRTEVDDDLFNICVNKELLIVKDDLYYEIEHQIEEDEDNIIEKSDE